MPQALAWRIARSKQEWDEASPDMTSLGKRWLWLIGWLGALLRFPALFNNDFHNDEALFASWARLIAVWRDPLLQGQPVDKPPLLFYLQAVFYPLQGPEEWAARLPGFIASLLLIPLLAMLAWYLYKDELATLLAALFVTLSPLAIQFSATAFTDPLLTTSMVLALYFVARATAVQQETAAGSWAAGFGFGMAVASKHQAWLFLPLVIGLALLMNWPGRCWRRALLGLVPWLLLLAAWELMRSGRLALWPTQISNFGGLRLAYSWEIRSRLDGWLQLGRWLVAAPWFMILIPFSLWPMPKSTGRDSAVSQLLLIYLAGYGTLHWLLAVPIWDRYWLPLVPLLALLMGRGGSRLWRQAWVVLLNQSRKRTRGQPAGKGAWPAAQWLTPGLLLTLFLVQRPPAVAAQRGEFPIGGQPGADHGTALVAQLLNEAPYGTVLYDHWYSWQWRYHLLDRRVYVSWFPHPDALAADLIAFAGDGDARYLALPKGDVARPVVRAVTQAGFQLDALLQPGDVPILLYRVVPRGPVGD